MRKIIFMILLILNSSLFGVDNRPLTDEECAKIIKTYKIDPKIKSKRGWEHVFTSEKWSKIFNLDVYNRYELDCIKEYILSNAMMVKKHNNYLGMEIKI